MIIKQYIKDFEKMGLGMFVHFGIYSTIGLGEWCRHTYNIPKEEYDKNIAKFKVKKTWARDLVKTAKDAGCKYITLTTRHHDGFSLYDTCGLNTYDAVHSPAGRDLVREFVDECRKADIVPFFYHTLIDWDAFGTDYANADKEKFREYLVYLRKSVEIICKNYGKIGGIWFDGMWANTNLDWEEDALYSMIRSYQPDAMIINNTGMEARGGQGNMELDSVTFERGNPHKVDFEAHGKYMATEMCQIIGAQWGYAPDVLNYKPFGEILNQFVFCRKYKANFLLNVGPKSDGSLDLMDRAYFEKLGIWMKYNAASVRDTDLVEAEFNVPDNFLVYDNANKCYYVFIYRADDKETVTFNFDKPIRYFKYLDGGKKIHYKRSHGKITFTVNGFGIGRDLIVRVAKIKAE